jgi:anti-sigma regulatory factor (Ser/Thr protein kinase)
MRSREATSVPADLNAPSLIRRFLRERAAEVKLPEDVTINHLIAASEAASNAVRHTRTPTVECTYRLAAGYVEVEIQDHGIYLAKAPRQARSGLDCWGSRLMAAVVDEVTVRPGTSAHPGTSVQFLKVLTHN